MWTPTHYSSSFLELDLIPFSAAYSANDLVAKPCIVSLIACVSASEQICSSKHPTTAPAQTIRIEQAPVKLANADEPKK